MCKRLSARGKNGGLAVRGLYIGDDLECFLKAAELSLKVNFEMLDEPIKKAVVYLDPKEFHSTWIGNKAVYRTRMALADGAELIILAPGVKEFGEDKGIDALIRKYGYRGTPATLKAVNENADLAADLSAAAHLIHASSEGRFKIVWCPGELSREEIEGVGFEYGDLKAMTERYDPEKLRHGWNKVGGEEIFFVANPGLGLWADRSRFESCCGRCCGEATPAERQDCDTEHDAESQKFQKRRDRCMGESRFEAEQIFGWRGRSVCAPGKGAVAGLHEGSRAGSRSGSGLEQVEPRTQHHRLRALERARGGRCGGEGAGMEAALLLRRRPHYGRDGGALSCAVRLFHFRCGRLYRPTRAGRGY